MLKRKRVYLIASLIFINSISLTYANEKEEIVYANLNYDGTVKNISVVNIIDNKDGKIVDYGKYDSVNNLTTQDIINVKDDEINIDTKEETLYYEGILSNAQFPWDINIEYKLDGKKMDAKDLAGKDGDLEINISVEKNENGKEEFYENYALQISTALDTNLCKDIIAEGASIVTSGTNKAISYSNLPDKEETYTIKAKVKDFEMNPISMRAMPFSMNIDLSKIEDMSKSLEPLQEGISKLSEGTNTLEESSKLLLNAINQMEKTSPTLINGSNSIYAGIGSLREPLEQIQSLVGEGGAIDSLVKSSQAYLEGTKEIGNKTSTILNASNEIYLGIQKSNSALNSLTAESEEVNNLIKSLEAMQNPQVNAFINVYNSKMEGIRGVSSGLNTLQTQYDTFNKSLASLSGVIESMSTNYEKIHEGISMLNKSMNGMTEMTKGVDKLYNEYAKFNDGLVSYTNGFGEIASGYKKLYEGLGLISSSTSEINDSASNMDNEISEKVDSMVSDMPGADFEVISFVSDKNKDVSNVQFMIKTEEIKLEEKEKVIEEKEEKLSFIDKIKNIFK